MDSKKGKPMTSSVPSFRFNATAEEIEELYVSDGEQIEAVAGSNVSDAEGSPSRQASSSSSATPKSAKRSTSVDIGAAPIGGGESTTAAPPSDPWRFLSDIKGKITKSVEGRLTEYNKTRTGGDGEGGSPKTSKPTKEAAGGKEGSSLSDSEELSESSISKTCGIVSTTEEFNAEISIEQFRLHSLSAANLRRCRAMAALKCVFQKAQLLRPLGCGIIPTVQQNEMSQYPKYYIRPVFKKEKQVELEKSGEASKLTHVPTRAALIDQTCSAFHDDDVRLFTNYVMRDGRKALARELVERALEKVKRIQLEKYHKAKSDEERAAVELNPRTVFHRAVENCMPVLQLTPIKRGGVRYQVPVPITAKRSQFMSMKWLIEAGQDKEKPVHFPEKLAYELVDAANNTGRVVRRKQELHKQCEANRAYAHYRWS